MCVINSGCKDARPYKRRRNASQSRGSMWKSLQSRGTASKAVEEPHKAEEQPKEDSKSVRKGSKRRRASKSSGTASQSLPRKKLKERNSCVKAAKERETATKEEEAKKKRKE
eukprot:1004752_1